MNYYYYSLIFIIFITLFIMRLHLSSLTYDNTTKKNIKLLLLSIILGAAFECIGKIMDETIKLKFPRIIIKAIELSITPLIPVCFSKIAKINTNNLIIALSFCAINAIMQIISIWTGNIFYINDYGKYTQGNMYFLYILIYSILTILSFVQIIVFAKKYQNTKMTLPLGILFLISTNIILKIILVDIKISWLTLTIYFLLFCIYYQNLFYQIDQMTGLLNKAKFLIDSINIHYPTAILVIDVNNFKSVNDTYGHIAGDVCLSKISKLILTTFKTIGLCYRIGGDEFAIILKQNVLFEITSKDEYFSTENALKKYIEKLNQSIEVEMKRTPIMRTVSTGFALYNPGMDTIEKVLNDADEQMYNYKKEQKENSEDEFE